MVRNILERKGRKENLEENIQRRKKGRRIRRKKGKNKKEKGKGFEGKRGRIRRKRANIELIYMRALILLFGNVTLVL